MRNTKALYDSLLAAGYSGALNDMLKAFIVSQGYTGALPDALYAWLGAQGYTGTMPERMYQWDEAGFTGVV